MSCCNRVRRARPGLGTIVEIEALGADPEQLTFAVEAAFSAVADVHRLMSFHDSTSDVSRLNFLAHKTSILVHPWTWSVLESAQEFSSLSDGAFDITVAPLLQRWGYLPGSHVRRSCATWRDIMLEPGNAVRFRRPLALDLGGIAKGFAVDRAVEALRHAGVSHGLVNAGGDLRVFGDEEREIYVRHPLSPGSAAGVLQIREKALATSAVYFSRRRVGHLIVSAIVHGGSRKPFIGDSSATVLAGNCLTADALTKIVLALGAAARPNLKQCGAEAFVLDGDLAPQFL